MPRVGFKHSEESLAKMRRAAKNRPPQSTETREKRAAAHRGRKINPEIRQRMSASALIRAARGISEETRQNISAAQQQRHVDHPQSEETKTKISIALTGRPKTPEHVEAAAAPQRGVPRGPMPEAQRLALQAAALKVAETYRGKEHHSFGKKPAHVRRIPYNGRDYRSSYEVRFAQLLDSAKTPFEYEPHTFDLGETTYTPDFFLPDYGLWCEVKGWMTSTAERKIDLFRDKFPNERLVVIPKYFFVQKLDLLQHGAQMDIDLEEAREGSEK